MDAPQKAAVVLFTMDGYNAGNLHRQFLAVFFRNNHGSQILGAKPKYQNKWRLSAITRVGFDGIRVFKSAKVGGSVIRLSGVSWARGNPMSDPTGAAYAKYLFARYSLIAVGVHISGQQNCTLGADEDITAR